MSEQLKRRDFLWLSVAGIASLGVGAAEGAPRAARAPVRFEWDSQQGSVIYAKDGTKLATLVAATVTRGEAVVGGRSVPVRVVEVSAVTHGWSCEEFSFPLLRGGAKDELCQVTCTLKPLSPAA